METRSKKRKLDSIKELERAESIAKFTKAITPLFDEFCEFVGLTARLKSLQDVQQNLKDNKYEDASQLVHDLNKIPTEMKKQYGKKDSKDDSTEATELNRYNEVDEYIQQTFVPIIHAPAILYVLQQHRRDIKIDSNHELVGDYRDSFSSVQIVSHSERLKFYLTWPLPKLTGRKSGIRARANDTSSRVKKNANDTDSTATTATATSTVENMTQESGSSLIVTNNTSHDAENSAGTIKRPFSKSKTRAQQEEQQEQQQEEQQEKQQEKKPVMFKIGRSKYEVGLIGFKDLSEFQILINKQNHLNRSDFVIQYVNEYLNSDAFKECVEKVWMPSDYAQYCALNVENEGDVEEILEKSLYAIIRPLVASSLDLYKEDVSKKMKKIIEEKPYVKVKVKGDKDDIPLISDLSKSKLGARFSGLTIKLDLEIGYFAEFTQPEVRRAVFYSSLGEVKYITMEIQPCIDRMQGKENDILTNSHLSEFRKLVGKYTRNSVLIGCSRLILTDLKSFLFIKLAFEDAPKDEVAFEMKNALKKKDSKNKKASKNDVSRKANAAKDEDFSKTEEAPNKEDAVDVVISNNILGDAPEKDGGSKNDAQNASDDSGKLKYIKSEWSVASMHDPYVRLMCLSFLSVNQKYFNELEEFKRLISEKMTVIYKLAGNNNEENMSISELQQTDSSIDEGDYESQDDIVPSSIVPTNLKETKYLLTPPDSRSRDIFSTDNERSIQNKKVQAWTSEHVQTFNSKATHFEERLFKSPSYGNIAFLITEIVEIGRRGSQVVKVDSIKFSKWISKQNMLYDKKFLPATAILKVYDPFAGRRFKVDSWGDRVFLHYNYQDCINYTLREVVAYCLLLEFSGTFIPHMYSYGRLSDLYPFPDPLYLRLCGGFLMLELLDEDPNFIITKKFFEKEILPLYNQMHSRNVLQNDIKKQNTIITIDGHFKIIDFGHSRISTSDLEKKAEIDLVYKHFGSSKWR